MPAAVRGFPSKLACAHLDEHHHVFQIISAPLVKRLQQLQPVALRTDVHREAGAVAGRVLVGVLPWVEVPGW